MTTVTGIMTIGIKVDSMTIGILTIGIILLAL